MVIIVLICALAVQVLTTTTLTTSNCPSSFNILVANDTSMASKQLLPSTRQLFYSTFNNDVNRMRVENIIINGDYDDLIKYLKQLAIPYIPIAIGSFLLYLIMICCCTCDKRCPPCQSWRRDPHANPYSKNQLRCTLIFAMLFAIGIIITCIVGFTIIPNFKADKDNTKCSIYMSFDTIINGDTTNNWGGFSQIQNSVGNISSLLTAAGIQVNSYFGGNDWIVTDMNSLKSTNDAIYYQNKNSTLVTPDPIATNSTPNSPPRIQSRFIQTNLGPTGNNNSMVDNIGKALLITEKLSTQAYVVENSAIQMNQSIDAIQNNTGSSQNVMTLFVKQLNQILIYLDAFSNSAFDQYFNYGLYAIQGTVGLILGGSLLIVIGMISSHGLKLLECRSMVLIGWVIYGFLHLIVILMVYVFLSVGSIGQHSCNYFNLFINNQTTFQAIADLPTKNYLHKLDSCLFGDGNILEQFGVSKQMKTVTNLFTNISYYNDLQDATTAAYLDTTVPNTTISSWISAMSKYQLGIYKDSYDNQTSNNNPNYAIDQLNQLTFQGMNPSACYKDRWVFDSTNCTDPTEEVYVARSNNTYGLTPSTVYTQCISLNEKLASSLPSWTPNDIGLRYQQILHTACNSSYQMINLFASSLINYRQSRIGLFKSIRQSLTALQTLNNNYNTKLAVFKGQVDGFFSSVSSLNNLVTNQINGLLVSNNCSVIKSNFVFIYRSFCINMMSRSTNLGVCMVVLSVLMVGGLISANVFANRYYLIEKENIKNVKVDIHSSSQDLGRDKEESEDSSKSSEDD